MSRDLSLPSAYSFSAGLRQVSTPVDRAGMREARELSIMGVTSTVRDDSIGNVEKEILLPPEVDATYYEYAGNLEGDEDKLPPAI